MNRSGRGKPPLVWLSATASFAIIGCTWAMAIARYGGPDEPAHVIRAAAAAHGDLRGRPVAKLEPGYREVRVPATFATGDPACYRHSETTTAACAAASNETADVGVATSAGTAPPWYYVIVGIITRMLSAGHSVMGYRMASVIVCALIFGCAMARAIDYRRGAWLMMALTPSSWFLLGVVGTSGIEIALVTLAVVEAVARFHRARPESLARVTLPLAVCLVLRPAALIDIAIVALVLIPTLPRPLTKRRVVLLSLPLASAGIASLAWSRWTGLIFRDRRTADTESFLPALWRSVRGIPLTTHQAVGALGWNEFFAPFIAESVWVGTLAFAAVWVVKSSTDRWWHLRWIGLAVLLPTVVEVILHRRIGEVWQGRYSIPFAIGGVFYAARGPKASPSLMRGLVIAAASAEVLTLWHTLRRYMVGLDGSMTLQGAAWRPPLNPWLLLAVNAAGVAWLAITALSPAPDDDPDPDQSPNPNFVAVSGLSVSAATEFEEG